jgi:hypothetical protein
MGRVHEVWESAKKGALGFFLVVGWCRRVLG